MDAVFYRKYRPRTFDELFGQDHIVQTLTRALSQERVAHAYLFTGPRGTGKTSIARILASAVNCTSETLKDRPCTSCSVCTAIQKGNFLDLVEIDAASNRGIDDIRDLRERVRFAPSQARYKIYIIDEVHMLTTEAFNALLKTLEEPPEHVIFILATTEPHKLPQTIISRCQRFDLSRGSIEDITSKLSAICNSEKIVCERDALELLSRISDGGFRDAEGLLDRAVDYASGSSITTKLIEEMLGLASDDAVFSLLGAMRDGLIAEGIEHIHTISQGGHDLLEFNKSLIELLRGMLLLLSGKESSLHWSKEQLDRARIYTSVWDERTLSQMIRIFMIAGRNMKAGYLFRITFELAFIDGVELSGSQVRSDLKGRKKQIVEEPQKNQSQTKQKVTQKVRSNHQSDSQQSLVAKTTDSYDNLTLDTVTERWGDVLSEVKPKNHSVEALLKACRPIGFSQNRLVLEFFYPFHKEKISSDGPRKMVEDALCHVFDRADLTIVCTLGEKKVTGTERKKDDLLDVAAEVLNATVLE